jgi:hypothetical protein
LHNVGSLVVVFNSARLVRQGEELEHFQEEQEKSGNRRPGPSTPRLAPKPA